MRFRGEYKVCLRAARITAFVCVVILVCCALCCGKAAAASLKAKAKAVVTEPDGAVVRASFSAESKKVGSLEQNTEFTITRERFTSRTSASQKTIWVYSRKLKGFVRSDLVSVTPSRIIKGKTTESVNVRKGAGTEFDVIKTLEKDKSVKVVLSAYSSKGKLWYKVICGPSFGYVSGDYVELISAVDDSGEQKKTEEELGIEKEKAIAEKERGKKKGQENSEPEKNLDKKEKKEKKQAAPKTEEPAGEPAKDKPKTPAEKTGKPSGKDKIAKNGFPASYNRILKQLRKDHPKWVFKPLDTGLTWKEATARMTKDRSANTVYATFAYPFRSVGKDCYNYLSHTYYPKDGNAFYSASNYAVRYFMDPRNWLDDTHIFMFESQGYHSYQTKKLVSAVFDSRNSTLKENAGSFVKAGKDYDINAIYLASKALGEQGGGVGCEVVDSKLVFNVFNIGACDSAGDGGYSAGMRFARNGKSYLRPWTSVDLSVRGGAKYIAKNFMAQKQNSGYLEHFNVMNGLDSVGTHYYMSAVYAPRNNATSTSKAYKKYGIYDKKITFYIPVYRDMPKEKCPKPSGNMKRDNNFYLKDLSVTIGDRTTTLISGSKLCYKKTFRLDAGGASEVKISAEKASVTKATVSGTGRFRLKKGENTLKVVCTASSGQKRVYKIKITN